MFQPDGWDARWRIGLLTPHADVGPESEFRAMAPGDVGIHVTRVPFGAMRRGGEMDATVALGPVRAFAEPPHVDEAIALLGDAPVQAIAFGFTSSSYVLGRAGEAAMAQRLSARAHGLPVIVPAAASVDALEVLGVRRIALFHPPWFDAELHALGGDYYTAAGHEVIFSTCCEFPSQQTLIEPDLLHEFIAARVPEAAEAVVIGGNGFRAVGVIEQLEETVGRPVLTANQVLLWSVLRAAAVTSPVRGYGVIFRSPGS